MSDLDSASEAARSRAEAQTQWGGSPYDLREPCDVYVHTGVTLIPEGVAHCAKARLTRSAWRTWLRDGETAADVAKELEEVASEAVRQHIRQHRKVPDDG